MNPGTFFSPIFLMGHCLKLDCMPPQWILFIISSESASRSSALFSIEISHAPSDPFVLDIILFLGRARPAHFRGSEIRPHLLQSQQVVLPFPRWEMHLSCS